MQQEKGSKRFSVPLAVEKATNDALRAAQFRYTLPYTRQYTHRHPPEHHRHTHRNGFLHKLDMLRIPTITDRRRSH